MNIQEVNIEIELTDCLVDVETGQQVDTYVVPITDADIIQLQEEKNSWNFDWFAEIKDNRDGVFKLVTENQPGIIQGLISLFDNSNVMEIKLIERRGQRTREKKYDGVGGNLFAFACKKSYEKNYDGCVCFIAKTNLIEYYKKTLGAQQIGYQRMYIDVEDADNLIKRYFN